MAQNSARKLKTMDIRRNKIFHLAIILCGCLFLGGCGAVGGAFDNLTSLAGLNDTGTVIVFRAQVRSSYSVVAADLLEVKRGQTLDILEDVEFEKVHWYRVRARDEDNTEGWIEAQNIIVGGMLEKSKKLAEENRDSVAQATGQLRAASNLRLAPEQKTENILYKLENGAAFEIVDWKYVPKAQDAADVDNASKSGTSGNRPQQQQRTKNADIEAAKEADKPQDLDEVYDVWYKVRLDPSVSPAPAGWVFGRQVGLQVPSDIVFYQSGTKKFVTWQRLDNADLTDKFMSKDKDLAKVSKPGSWVILTRSNTVKAKDGSEPYFDGILVLGYDKYNEEHYTAYRLEGVWGNIPLRVSGAGDNRQFVLSLRNAAGQFEDKTFTVVKDARSRMRVTAPPDIYTEKNVR